MLRVALVLLAVGIVVSPGAARAWGDEGHRVVALVAQRLLTSRARQQVDALLAADPDGLTSADLAARATWADRAAGQTRFSGTRPWHHVDIDVSRPDLLSACFRFAPLPPGTPASAGTKQACVVDKVEQFARELSDPATREDEKILALKFLLNLVGDLHEPLLTDDHGRDVHVLHDQGTVAIPLSTYWDTVVVEKLGSDPQAVADSLLIAAENETAEWSAGTPRTWATETFAVAREVAAHLPATMSPNRNGTPAARLDVTYAIPAVEAARQQLARAGVRLAVLLNDALR